MADRGARWRSTEPTSQGPIRPASPSFERPLVVEISYSFPSRQAMESLVVYGMLTFFVVLTSRAWGKRAVSVGGAAMIVLLIGFSRVYLGAHYGLLAV